MILVTGASGFLGANLIFSAVDSGRDVIAASRSHALDVPGVRSVVADLAAPGSAGALLKSTRPDWVVNCAALANVDACEANPEAARQANVELPRAIASACRESGSRLLHISTDSVFDGAGGSYEESDEPRPVNSYAATKLAGESAVLDTLPGAVVLRTNFIGVGPLPGVGLADWIVGRLEQGERVKGFSDVVFSPLLTLALAEIIFSVVDAGLEGLFHASARDACSKFDLARMLAGELGLDGALVDEARMSDAGLAAPRPLNTSLSPALLERTLGRPMPSVADAVKRYAGLRREGFASRFEAVSIA